MHLFTRSALVALALGALGSPVAAQDITPANDGPARKGFYIGLGLAGAQVDADCEGCADADPATFFGTHIKLGGTLSPKFRLGADLFGVQTSEGLFVDLAGGGGDVTEGAGHAMLALTFYPSATGNLWIQGGIGGVAYFADADLRLGRNGSITPYVSWTGSSGGKLYDENGDEVSGAGDWETAFFAIGVDYIFH
jgi:hypothetical protein